MIYLQMLITHSVPEEGLEPSPLARNDFESFAYTNSATPAIHIFYTKSILKSIF